MTESAPTLPQNAIIGILGGGQLGRMLSLAATQLGFRTHIYCPEENAPASHCALQTTLGQYDDQNTLEAFATGVDVVTYEFENVPVETVKTLTEVGKFVLPGAKALEVAQDRLIEKQFLNDIGATTAPFRPVDDLTTLDSALKEIGPKSILKTRRLGYDGKGQTTIKAEDNDLGATWEAAIAHAWEELGQSPSILEGFVDFDFEISIIAARSIDGEVKCYPPSTNYHQGGILRRSTYPSAASKSSIDEAVRLTTAILEHLSYVGVIGVEFFVLKNGDLVVNEFAPRVHNSGHWTDDACSISQFEQHIRAITGWPLGDTKPHSGAVMENLIGDEVFRSDELTKQADANLHLYGKTEARPGRKMGHVTFLKPLP